MQPSSHLILPLLNKLPPNSCTILSPLAAQLLAHFNPSGEFTPSLLHHFTPPPPLGCPALTSFYPLLTNYPLILKPLSPPLAAQLLAYFTPSDQFTHSLLHFTLPPPLQPSSYLILPLLNKLPPHSCTILSPLAAQLLAHFNPSGEFTLSLLHHFTSPPPTWLPCSNPHFPPSEQITPQSHTILSPLAAQLLAHFTPSEQFTHSLLHFTPLQPSSHLILPLLNKLPPHSYTILSPLADQLLAHFNPSGEFTPSLCHHFTPPPPPLGCPALTSFYPLLTNYPLILKPFSPPLAAQLLAHFTPI